MGRFLSSLSKIKPRGSIVTVTVYRTQQHQTYHLFRYSQICIKRKPAPAPPWMKHIQLSARALVTCHQHTMVTLRWRAFTVLFKVAETWIWLSSLHVVPTSISLQVIAVCCMSKTSLSERTDSRHSHDGPAKLLQEVNFRTAKSNHIHQSFYSLPSTLKVASAVGDRPKVLRVAFRTE